MQVKNRRNFFSFNLTHFNPLHMAKVYRQNNRKAHLWLSQSTSRNPSWISMLFRFSNPLFQFYSNTAAP